MRPIVAPAVCALLLWSGACGPASEQASEESLDPATPVRAQTTAVSAGDVRASVFQEEADKPTPKIDAARAEVAANPDDPEANLAAGRWYCFEQFDWERGLPHLAKCNNSVLQRLATQELSAPPTEPISKTTPTGSTLGWCGSRSSGRLQLLRCAICCLGSLSNNPVNIGATK